MRPCWRFAAAGMLLLAGCGGNGHGGSTTAAPSTHTSSVSSSSTAPSGAAERCGGPTTVSRPVPVRTGDGLTLPAYVVGAGERGVVLVHEAGSQLCGWWPYATRLAGLGLHVLLFDDRCSGEAPCPQGAAAEDYVADADAAVAALRADGAGQVAMVGGSRGGAVVVAAAADPPPGLVAVVTLSADLLDSPMTATAPPVTAQTAAAGVRLPTLMAVARHDRNVTVADTRALLAAVPSADKRLLVLPPDAGHGWDLLRAADYTSWSRFAGTVEDYLTAQLGA